MVLITGKSKVDYSICQAHVMFSNYTSWKLPTSGWQTPCTLIVCPLCPISLRLLKLVILCIYIFSFYKCFLVSCMVSSLILSISLF